LRNGWKMEPIKFRGLEAAKTAAPKAPMNWTRTWCAVLGWLCAAAWAFVPLLGNRSEAQWTSGPLIAAGVFWLVYSVERCGQWICEEIRESGRR